MIPPVAVAYPYVEKLASGVKTLLVKAGISLYRAEELDGTIFALIIITASLLFAWGLRIIVNRVLLYLFRNSKNRVVTILFSHKIFSRIIFLLPPLIIVSLLPLIYDDYPHFIKIIERISWIYFVIALSVYINFFLTAVWHILSTSNVNKTRPLHGILQLFRGVVISLGTIAVISIIIDKSPLNLITGLGAFAAVLMLVFKDTIIGFVSGVQLSQNDIIRKDDWIVTANGFVDGIVVDITLNTVKIRNFDNTITTIPPYTLISEPLQNWRGMEESGGRRITISIMIDMDTIKDLNYPVAASLPNLPDLISLKDYIAQKELQREAGKIENTDNSKGLVNGTIETNLGLFRAYIAIYLKEHPFVNKELLLMIRLLQPTENGVPMQLYFFSANKEWKSYESIKSEILEHVLSVSTRFKLKIYQNASGRDYMAAAYITAGKPVPSPDQEA